MQEYAVYKGEELLAIGTAKECAKKLGVTPKYIRWMTSPVAQRRIEKRNQPGKATTAVRLND